MKNTLCFVLLCSAAAVGFVQPAYATLSSDNITIKGETASNIAGRSVSKAGDINGDGYQDFIVGAPFAAPNGANSGKAYVIFGSSTLTKGSEINLSDIANGAGGFVINGETAGDMAGYAVAGGGDINGDGYDDIVIGAPYNATKGTNAGKAYVIFGKANPTAVNLSTIEGSTNGFVIYGAASYYFSGGSLAIADVNGDGLDDVLVGKHYVTPVDSPSGMGNSNFNNSNPLDRPHVVYVVFGKTTNTTVQLMDIATGIGGFVIGYGGTNTIYVDNNGYAAYRPGAFTTVGDVNGDGLADILIGISPLVSAKSKLVYGKNTTTTVDLDNLGSNGISLSHTGLKTSFSSLTDIFSGLSASPAIVGDINGDGIEDVAITIPNPVRFSESQPVVYVGFGSGSLSSTLNMNTNAASGNGFGIYNDVTAKGLYSSFMLFVKGAGDVNGDGLDDLLISDPYDTGRFYVVYGKTTTTNVKLSDIVNGSGGFVFIGNASNDYLGWDINPAGDVNGDGIADFIVGAPGVDVSGATDAGSAYLQLGSGSSITQWGTAGNDTLTGTTGADYIAAGAGDDTITGNGGADVLYGGAGNDTFIISDTNFARIDGGTGTNTLQFAGAGMSLNMAAAPQRVRNIQVFDITGTGDNTITLLKTVSGNNKITVKGNAGDKVNSFNQNWTESGTTTIDGITYTRYTSNGITLLLQSGVILGSNRPPVAATAQSFTVNENTLGGTVVGTVVASDSDIGDTITYTITAGNSAGHFSINPSTGVLSVASTVASLDYESIPKYTLTVQVKDSFGEAVNITVTVNVTDQTAFGSSQTLSLSKTGQSIWGSNSISSLIGEISPVSGTVSYNLSNLPQGNMTVMKTSVSGTLSLSSSFNINGGTTDINVPMSLNLSYPDEIKLGSTVKLSNSFNLDPNAKFTASAPAFSFVGTASLKDFAYSIKTSYSDSSALNTINSVTRLPSINSSASVPGTIKDNETIASTTTTATSSISSTSPIKLQASINQPAWIDQQLTFSWKDILGKMILKQLLEGCYKGATGNINPYQLGDLYYKLYFSIIDTSLRGKVGLTEDFTLDIKPIATLTLENGDVKTFTPGSDYVFTMPTNADSNGDGVVTATLKLSLTGTFTNRTNLTTTISYPVYVGNFVTHLDDAYCVNNHVTINTGSSVNVDENFTLLSVLPSLTTTNKLAPIQFNVTGSDAIINLTFDLCNAGTTCAVAAVNTPNTASSVEVTGTTEVGQILTGTYTYSDSNGKTESGSTYQWYRANNSADTAGVAISGATNKTYTLVSSDSGRYVRFCVTPSDGTTFGTQACSSWIYIFNTPPTVSSVNMSGTTTVGKVLTGSYTYSDTEGNAESGSIYQWYRADSNTGINSTPIANATSKTYTLVTADFQNNVRFCVTPNDGIIAGTETCSNWSATISNTAPTVSNVTITGVPKIGQTVNGTYTYADSDSNAETGSVYQWYRANDTSGANSVSISGATGITYALTANDSDRAIKFCVTPNDGTVSGNQVCSNWQLVSPTVIWYQDINFTGNSFNVGYALTDNGKCINVKAYNMNDLISSMSFTARKNYSTQVIWYKDVNCAGTVGGIGANAGATGNVSSFVTLNMNDAITAFRVVWIKEKRLTPNGTCYSPNTVLMETELSRLIFQNDGNLVLYNRFPADGNWWTTWNTSTGSKGATKVCFQTDSNLVVYAGSTALWASNTDGKSVDHLRLQTDCNLVMYNNYADPIWASGTGGCYKGGPSSSNALSTASSVSGLSADGGSVATPPSDPNALPKRPIQGQGQYCKTLQYSELGTDRLGQVNRLPQLQGMTVKQSSQHGGLEAMVDGVRFAMAIAQYQVTPDTAMPTGLTIQSREEQINFNLEGEQLITQPALQSPCAFEQALQSLGIGQFSVGSDGLIRAAANRNSWFVAQPEWFAKPLAQATTARLELTKAGHVPNFLWAALQFKDDAGGWQQDLVPALASRAELETAIAPIEPQGMGIFTITGIINDNQPHRFIPNYLVETADNPSGKLSVEAVGDQNSDGLTDYRILYSDGYSQLIFAVQ